MKIAEGLACVVENLGRVDNIAGVCVVNVVIASPAIAVRVNGIVFSLLDLAYAWFQDRVTFPKTFCDYEDYQKKVPFLIPTGDCIRLARQTRSRSVSEEDET